MVTTQTDLLAETLIPLGELRNMVPSGRPGKRLDKATIWRWAVHGVRGVKLESEVIGNTRYTSLPAFHRFRAALNQRPAPFTPSEQPNRPTEPQTALAPIHPGHTAAMKTLEAAGI